jgi:Major intrinsic protein
VTPRSRFTRKFRLKTSCTRLSPNCCQRIRWPNANTSQKRNGEAWMGGRDANREPNLDRKCERGRDQTLARVSDGSHGSRLFMVSACSFTVLLQHPGSAIRHMLPSAFARRLVTGVAMGLTAIALIYSPWGKQSGAHLNPSVTLTFFGLGKIEPRDAAFYAAARHGKLHGRHDFRCCSAV